ncbi:MAG: polysaccharide biosynthesis C-terminal domain-containing protein [Flavipsychrobacter sp.]|nr:polysaccharide biosynthesis C-terminal domain-containing protein [Flavipsychrobacter sp.]
MGIVFRQSVKTTIVIALGAVMGACINIAYTHMLVNRDFGFITYILAVCAMLQMLVQFGTSTLLQTFIQKYNAADERRPVLFTFALCVPLITVGLLCIPFFLFKTQIINYHNPADRGNLLTFYNLVPFTVLLWSYMTVFDLFFVSQSRPALSTFMREVVLRVCNITLMLLLFLKVITFTVFVTGLLLMYGIPVLVLFLITAQSEEKVISFNWRAFTKKEYGEMLHFSWYHLLLFASAYLIGSIDVLMLGAKDKIGMESLPVYKIALYIISLMLIPSTAMTAATYPMLNKAYLNNAHDELQSLFKRSAINILLVTLGVVTILFCNLHNIDMFLGKGIRYEQLLKIFSILMIGRLIDVATGLNNDLISISRYYKFSFRISILLVGLVFVFDYLLIPRYSVYGAAWGTTLAFSIFNILKMVFLWKKLKIQPFTYHTLMLFAAILPALIAGLYLPFVMNKYIDLMARSLTIAFIYAGMLLWLKPSPDLTTYLASVKKDKRLF